MHLILFYFPGKFLFVSIACISLIILPWFSIIFAQLVQNKRKRKSAIHNGNQRLFFRDFCRKKKPAPWICSPANKYRLAYSRQWVKCMCWKEWYAQIINRAIEHCKHILALKHKHSIDDCKRRLTYYVHNERNFKYSFRKLRTKSMQNKWFVYCFSPSSRLR